MATLTDIVDFLAGAGLGLTVGTNLFQGYQGDTSPWPDACVVVYEYEGSVQDSFGLGVAITMPRIQVLVRGAIEDYATPRALAESVRTALAGVHPGTITKVESIRPTGTVNSLGRDGNERPQFSANFQAMVNA